MRRRSRAGRVAAVLAATSTVLAVPFVVLIVAVERTGGMPVYAHWLPDLFTMVTIPWLGALILSRQPRNRFGWLLAVIGLCSAADGLAAEYARYAVAVHPLPAPGWVLWFGALLGAPSFFSLVLVPQLFPDGRTLSVRWEWLFRSSVALIVLASIAGTLSPGRLDDAVPIANPLPVHTPAWDALTHVIGPVTTVWALLTVVLAFASLVVRYRRSRGAQRNQMKLFTFVLLLVPVLVEVQNTFPGGFVLGALATAGLPAALALAILRHGLYDIDRIISRTVSYALLTGTLLGVYVGCVALTTRLLAFSSSFGVAASTLAAAALFQPVRRRLQALVDRRFNRARYDGQRTVDGFAARLRDVVDFDAVHADLSAVVQRTVQPASLSLWVREAS